MEIRKSATGKFLYGILFIVILPALLFLWAEGSEKNIKLNVPYYPEIALGILIVGLLMLFSGMLALIKYGLGLPMNPFPPEKYVVESIYNFIPHPIYTGFIFICIGVFILLNSSGGLWLVTPIVILSIVSLIQGYEKIDLQTRFGKQIHRTFIHLPEDNTLVPKISDRVSVYVLVLIPWLILYEVVQFFGIPQDAIVAYLPFESKIPVLEWTEIFYVTTYLFVIAAPFMAKTNSALRKFSLQGLYATAFITLIYLSVPLIAPQKEFTISNPLGKLLMWERQFDSGAGAFPSFHVVWAFLAASLYVRKSLFSKIFWYGLALLISLSCITTGMHAIVDVLSGYITLLFIKNISKLWKAILHHAEKIANSWKEVDLGWIRIINHGGYAAIGTFIGISIAGFLAGPSHVPWIFFIAIFGMILSALWAQFIEGSPALLRPYGYYGGVLGVIVASTIAMLFGENVWLLLAAFSIAGPWIQSFGRLRCLVQGCCHGRETSDDLGIKYFHPRSRVTRLSNLKGLPIHPTPVYSISWNIFIAVVITRLWFLGSALPLISGLYLILTGIGRFTEEALRGEPQTPIYYGLRLYQWVAISTLIIGAVMTTIQNENAYRQIFFSWDALLSAFVFGILTWIGLGVDFPKSNKRFARLV